MRTFEELLRIAQEVQPSATLEQRQILWCEDNKRLGISRQAAGAFELFLVASEIFPTSPLVARHLRFDRWSRANGGQFEANRLVLPADTHYISVVAFIAEELLRNGVVESVSAGFARSEAVIEMALRRLALAEETVLGLLGELRFLEVMLAVAKDSAQRLLVLDCWRGHERAARDFHFGSAAVEVKATRGVRSAHRIGSVAQVDPRRSDSGEPIESLYLLSAGFEPMESGVGLSLPDQVEAILSLLGREGSVRNDAQRLFLSKVAAYGSGSWKGYSHDEMKDWGAYRQTWQHSFVRVYDMNDSAVRVPRRSDLAGFSHVRADSVGFEIELPDRIVGDRNPQVDLYQFGKVLVSGIP